MGLRSDTGEPTVVYNDADEGGEGVDISVLMTTFNHESYIEQAINSVLSQNFDGRIEIVVADDASQDNTVDRVIRLQATDSRIRLCASDRRLGVSRNFARALSYARGTYIAILDGDDYWIDPLKCQRQVDFLRLHPEAVGSFEAVFIVDQAGNTLHEHRAAQVGTVLSQIDFVAGYPLTSQTLMLRRRACEVFPEWAYATPCQDWVISWIASASGAVVCTGDFSAAYRQSASGVWTSQSPRRQLAIFLHAATLLNAHGALAVASDAQERQYQAAYRSFRHYVDHQFSLIDALAIAVMISVHTRGRTIKRLIENSIWVLRTYASRALGRTRFV